jgi:hypothetical protein
MLDEDKMSAGGALPRPQKMHHVLEDFLTLWTGPLTHILPLRRFLEACINSDLSHQEPDACFLNKLISKNGPRACNN